jgi:hypothetical protein
MQAHLARKASLLKFKSTEIKHLKQQVAGCRTFMKTQRQRIADLEEELDNARESLHTVNATPADVIYSDLSRNRGVHPSGRRYSIDTISWAREIADLSPAAYEVVRAILPVPSCTLLRSKFLDFKHRVQRALMDTSFIDDLIEIWRRLNGSEAFPGPIPAILSVDAVAIRPLITVHEDGRIDGLDNLSQLETPDLFSQFITDPRHFHDFICQHWDSAYSSLFVDHIQPVAPDLTCCAIHCVATTNGKGNPATVAKLREMAAILGTKGFNVLGYAFDGDSCFDGLHSGFLENLKGELNKHQSPDEFFTSANAFPLIISDPLHILKRIRYRFLAADFQIGFGRDDNIFSIKSVKAIVSLPPIVFDNSKITKMHDSLALSLFSPGSLATIFGASMGPALFAFFPWFLLISGLTGPTHSTRTRCHFFETAFWILFFYQNLLDIYPHPSNAMERIPKDKFALLYTTIQLRHALNTLYSLIVILRTSPHPICLNRIGSNPLEHLFGKARLRCRDVNVMKRFLSGIAAEFVKSEVDHLLEIVKVKKRRTIVGLDCEPWSLSAPSTFTIDPMSIAAKVLELAGLPIQAIYRNVHGRDLDYYGSIRCIIGFGGEGTKTYASRPPERKQLLRQVSTAQLFLGVTDSPRRESLILGKSRLSQATSAGDAPGDTWIDGRLAGIYGARPSVPQLRELVQILKRSSGLAPPIGRRRTDILEWMATNWRSFEGIIGEMSDHGGLLLG